MSPREPRPEPDFAAIADAHNAHGGSTWGLVINYTGEHWQDLMGWSSLWAVGAPRRSAAVKGRIVTPGDVEIAWDLIGRPDVIGTWHDPERGWSIMEPVTLHVPLSRARTVAKRRHGRAIWDLEHGVVIPLGLDGLDGLGGSRGGSK